MNKNNSEGSPQLTKPPGLNVNLGHGPKFRHVHNRSFCALCDAADVRELDAVVDTVVRGVGPDDGPISLMQVSSIVHDTTPGIDGPGGHQREHPPQLQVRPITVDRAQQRS